MNIKHSVNVPALSGSRSSLRRAITTAVAGCALVLGVASAQADGDGGGGKFTVKATAAKLNVGGDGKFNAKFDGTKLVFTSKTDVKGNLDMGMRQDHTVKEFNLEKSPTVELSIPVTTTFTLPKDGKEVSGETSGSLRVGGKTIEVKGIKYTAKDAGNKYEISNASFTFDYTAFTGKEICAPLVKTPCVAKTVTVTASGKVKKP